MSGMCCFGDEPEFPTFVMKEGCDSDAFWLYDSKRLANKVAIRAGFCSSCVGSFVSPFVINPTDSVCERHHRLNIDLFTCSDSRGARCDLAARANIIVYNRVALMTNALYRHGSWFAQVVRRRDTSRRDQVHHFRYAAWNFSKKELKHLEFRDAIVPKL